MTPSGDVRRYGETAFLVDLPDLAAVRALDRCLASERPGEVLDVVPAARTVLVTFQDAARSATVERWVREALERVAGSHAAPQTEGAGAEGAAVVELPVVYDGADLADVAAWAGISEAEVVARHSGRAYEAAFGGFAPGFVYLVGVDPVIAAPRLATPRPHVPAGAVAVAGELTAVYPTSSPGGWRLLGTTAERMFDVERDPPALVAPGARVRFLPARAVVAGAGRGPLVPDRKTANRPTAGKGTRNVDGSAAPAAGEGRALAAGEGADANLRGAAPALDDEASPALTVLSAGPQTLVQDLGRPGLGAIGVGPSGVVDRGASALANRLVGNDRGAALLEVTLGGLTVRFDAPAVVALTGADAPATVDGTPVGRHATLRVGAGSVLSLGMPSHGIRTYVAVRGGVDVDPVLGSRSRDVLSGLGPRPLAAGDVLGIGSQTGTLPPVELAPVRHEAGTLRPGERHVVLPVIAGTRPEWFLPGAWQALGALRTVTANSNRVALRLDGQVVPRRDGELPSEGVVRGAVQVPPDGRPVVFLADHPVTGGYPVIGVLTAEATDRAAQLRPGDSLRLRAVRGVP
ncbi:urea amidolyase family protein [Cellulosimicrobium sp. PMB13]|uniref:5-oxoprolinase subunit B/C family protein n=1 Tax=Cellulosimicrobium sp. PMB13 TaxID=3120158 RepID=UPI003F4C80F6